MRQIKVPNSGANEYGVELDALLSDGSKALGIIQVTDGPSPFNSGQTLVRVNAWQVRPNGHPVHTLGTNGQQKKVAIREMLVPVPDGEYTHLVADQQIVIAAAALVLVAIDLPELTTTQALPAVAEPAATVQLAPAPPIL